MGNLCDEFMRSVNKIGFDDLVQPIFYNAPIGIRFEIGGDQDVYLNIDDFNKLVANPEYVLSALARVKTIYESMPQKPNILRIDVYPDEENDVNNVIEYICNEIGIPQPHEQIYHNIQCHEDDVITQIQLYWDLNKISFSAETLLYEVIMADIGGYSALVSSVFLVNTDIEILFYLYDDRGADVMASDKEVLRSMFDKFQSWILDYDRKKINEVFENGNGFIN